MIALPFEVAGWGVGVLHYDGPLLLELDEPAARAMREGHGAAPAGAADLAARIGRFLAGDDVRFDDVDVDAACVRLGLTDLQRRMVAAVRSIPRGETASYGEVAALAGAARAPRAAGAACARGPLSIVVPYHRVISGDGGIGMYGPLGTERKRRLLALEGVRAR